MGRIILYYHTVKNLKPSQVINRLRIKLGKGCTLGVTVNNDTSNIQKVESPEHLDFDPMFTARFPIKDLMADRITLLHSSKHFEWNSKWEFEDKSALWNFNLHYFEFLLPLVREWKNTGVKNYLDKTIEMIEGWINNNPKGSKPGWGSYTIALRIVSWISYFGYVAEALPEGFKKKFLLSLHDQFLYLSKHLEKDILGNHYFEDLKSLVIASLFFRDEVVLKKALSDFKAECREEILSDGMHFELSPMYHKIVFEGMLRVAIALKVAGKKDAEIEAYLQPMLDVAYSFEEGLERVPLFNDGGNNVAKSLNALVITSKDFFGLDPIFKSELRNSGYYIFKQIKNDHTWKLIVDAGQPGPKYIPGHAHCDAMSYELFCDGKPLIVNCGTYAYQCKERYFFRSTSAHNTVMVDGIEQSQCWGNFRLAKRSNTRVVYVNENSITMEMMDQCGNIVVRNIKIEDSEITIMDTSEKTIKSFIHIRDNTEIITIDANSSVKVMMPYAEDYGIKTDVETLSSYGNKITTTISLKI